MSAFKRRRDGLRSGQQSSKVKNVIGEVGRPRTRP